MKRAVDYGKVIYQCTNEKCMCNGKRRTYEYTVEDEPHKEHYCFVCWYPLAPLTNSEQTVNKKDS